MSIFRINKNRNFTVMSNVHLRDRALSYKAKGLLSYMLSCPDDWDYSLKGLAAQSGDGIDSVRTGIKELETNRYLRREKVRDAHGHIVDYDYQVFEEPYEPDEDLEDEKPVLPAPDSPKLDFPKTVKPKTGFPKSGNPMLLNTKRLNTKEPNTIYLQNGGEMDEKEVEQQFEEQLEYGVLRRRFDPALLDELLRQIVEMYCCKTDQQYIGRQPQSTKAVRGRLDALNAKHIQYIMESLRNTTVPVKNIQAYMRTAIMNAPNTMEHYYQSCANQALSRNRRY